MSRKTDAVVARTIGIDTGKNTLHLIGLDDKGAIVLREKLTRGRIAARLANVPQCLSQCRRSAQDGSIHVDLRVWCEVPSLCMVLLPTSARSRRWRLLSPKATALDSRF